MRELVLSIIVPVYNVESYVERFIDSISNQTYKENFECILIDDGSTDDSRRKIEKKIKNSIEFKLFHKQNEGVSSARNLGIENSKGKYLYFADPDDFLEENFLDEIIKNIDKKNADIYFFGYKTINEKKEEIFTTTYIEELLDSSEEIQNKFLKLMEGNNLNVVWNKVYKSSLIRENNIFFPVMRTAEDAIFNYSVYDKATSIKIMNGIYYNYLYARNDSALSNSIGRFKDDYNLLEHKIRIFSSWRNVNLEELKLRSLSDLIINQLKTFHGEIPNEIKNSIEFNEIINQVKNISLSKICDKKLLAKYILIKFKLYKVLWTIVK